MSACSVVHLPAFLLHAIPPLEEHVREGYVHGESPKCLNIRGPRVVWLADRGVTAQEEEQASTAQCSRKSSWTAKLTDRQHQQRQQRDRSKQRPCRAVGLIEPQLSG